MRKASQETSAEKRQEKEIETTGELVDIIKSSMPAKAKNGKGHPAKRTFQAIRIELNHELDVLQDALDRHGGSVESGRTIVYYHLPFFGRSDCEKLFPKNGKPMYLPAGFSGLRMWKETKRKSDNQKTNSSG